MQKAGLLSAADVAQYLNVCEHTVYRWCKSGKIPFYNLSSTYRFDSTEIEEWLTSQHHIPGNVAMMGQGVAS